MTWPSRGLAMSSSARPGAAAASPSDARCAERVHERRRGKHRRVRRRRDHRLPGSVPAHARAPRPHAVFNLADQGNSWWCGRRGPNEHHPARPAPHMQSAIHFMGFRRGFGPAARWVTRRWADRGRMARARAGRPWPAGDRPAADAADDARSVGPTARRRRRLDERTGCGTGRRTARRPPAAPHDGRAPGPVRRRSRGSGPPRGSWTAGGR